MNRAYNLLRGYINREWDRIKGFEHDDASKELNEALQMPRPTQPSTYTPPPSSVEPPVRARQILGVPDKARYSEVRKAFEKLSKRSDPSNFPHGSEEARQAAEIHKRVHWAYRVLSENVDVTEKRFNNLELD
jgi:hypothetical protein